APRSRPRRTISELVSRPAFWSWRSPCAAPRPARRTSSKTTPRVIRARSSPTSVARVSSWATRPTSASRRDCTGMSPGSAPLARVLLKARPTPTQLADRFAPPWPQGLELYLDRADIATDEECQAVIDRIRAYDLPDDFAFVVEGPIRSLDGEY